MYKIATNISPVYSSTLNEDGLFLWIWNPEQKSPHIGISLDGKYYSLKRDAKQEAVDVDKILLVISRKEKSVLFVELTSKVNKRIIADSFKDFTGCEIDNCSCSLPIFNLFDVDKPNAILFDLLDKLNDDNNVKGYFQINLPENFSTIPAYTYADVQNNLQKIPV